MTSCNDVTHVLTGNRQTGDTDAYREKGEGVRAATSGGDDAQTRGFDAETCRKHNVRIDVRGNIRADRHVYGIR